jgi:hypothetical protein
MLFLACASFANTHASYHIGSNPIGSESMQGFIEANFPLSLDQGKHWAHIV